MPAEYRTAFAGQTDSPEVRFDLTDTQTHRPNYSNPHCACAPRVKKSLRNCNGIKLQKKTNIMATILHPSSEYNEKMVRVGEILCGWPYNVLTC